MQMRDTRSPCFWTEICTVVSGSGLARGMNAAAAVGKEAGGEHEAEAEGDN